MLIRVVDLETGGFAPPHGCCEAAWTQIRWTMDRGYHIDDQCRTFLDPEHPMSSEAIRTHGISEADCRGYPSTKFVSKFMRWNGVERNPDGTPAPYEEADVKFLVAHNAKFEWQWIDPAPAQKICTLICAKKVFPGLRSYKNESIFDALGLRAKADPAKCQPLHRALPDTYLTAHILLEMLKKYTPQELADLTAGKAVGTGLTYGKYKGVKIDDPIVPAHYLRWILNESSMHQGHKADAREELERRGELLIDPRDNANR